MTKITDLIHNANLTISGHSIIVLRFLASSISRDSDGLTYEGKCRFKALVEES